MWPFKKKEKQFGTGAIPQPYDERDYEYDGIAMGASPLTEEDWDKGYSVEDDLEIEIPFKNQGISSSCIGNGWAYYIAVINAIELDKYDEQSAKAIYSQIFLPSGGAYIRDGAKIAVNWGSVKEKVVPSYENGKAPTESFCRELNWKNEKIDKLAEIMQAKEYRVIVARNNIDTFAKAIRDNKGVVSGVHGSNNGTWNKLEPKPPVKPEWGHCIFFGGYGRDSKGKYILTINSWGDRFSGKWQKIREDYFASGHMFDAWTLVDKININDDDMEKFRIIQEEGEQAVWFIGRDGKRRFFFDEDQYREIAPILGLSVDFKELEVLTKEQMGIINVGKPIVVIK